MTQLNTYKRITIKYNKYSILLSVTLIIICLYMLLCYNGDYYMLSLLVVMTTIMIIFFVLPGYLKYRSTTLLFLLICLVLKDIITPLMYSIAPISRFSNYIPNNSYYVNHGVLIMVFEVIAVSLVTCICVSYEFRKSNVRTEEIIRHDSLITSKNTVVAFFVIFAIAVAFLIPSSRTGLSFIALKSNTGVRVSLTETTPIIVFLREIVLIGAYSLFIIIAVWCGKKYILLKSKKYVFTALLSGLMVTMIIISEARSSQVYSGYACIVLLTAIFPDNKKRIQRVLVIAMVIVVLFLSIYKTFYAFRYSSYSEAISAANIGLETLTYNLEIYCLGPLHYSSVIEMSQTDMQFTITRFIFGFLRSVMGTNLLVKNNDISTTSMLYNEFITANKLNTGHLLPITGLGYLYFSSIFAPIITCIIYGIATKVELIMKKSRSAFGLFFSAYVYIRIATCIICTNINTILTMSSMILWTAGLLYVVNRLIK